MFCISLISALTAFFVAAATLAGADTILVPDDFATIQAAINACDDGDQVVIADGVYTGVGNYDLTFNGRLITVRSASGDPASCIIDCNGLGRGFILDDGETRAAVIEGLTIANGNAPIGNGGGIDIALGTSPTIRNCIVRDCTAISLGGGIAARGECLPLIEGCTFLNNTAIGSDQGAEGGGLCLFFLSHGTVRNCTFIGNFSRYGGGLSCALSDAEVINCVFTDNEAQISGGAATADVANPRFVNCTMAGNSANAGGAVSGIGAYLESFPVLENCILWDNAPHEIVISIGEATVRYSNIQGGWPGVGNIDADPRFRGPTLAHGAADFLLLPDSPCIDAGDNTAVPSDVNTDILGHPRFQDHAASHDTGNGDAPIVDMGAIEFQPCPGDLNEDRRVDQADLGILLASYGVDGGGDVDGDGDTDQADLGALLGNFGAHCDNGQA
jgi:hypothetical protein